jgi:23S rRNA (guanosine2251-2'-O)-methyltransferase
MRVMPKRAPKQVYILLHNIRSTHNVGSIFRTADAAGVTKVFLSGYTPQPVDRFGRAVKELKKVALGGEQSVAWEYIKNPTALLKKLKSQGVYLIGIEQNTRAVDYKKVKPKSLVLFMLGNEVEGISSTLLKLCDVVAEIPMHGKKESLNVAVTAGIALFRMLNI